MIPEFLLLVPGAYVLGATPTSHWVALRFHGVDLRERGSGNLGATNTYRELGAGVALPVLLFDIFKGWGPVFLALHLAGAGTGLAVATGAAAVLGHVFSFWVGFRGGKGVATGAGVFLALSPLALGIVFLVWLATLALTRIVSLGSILAALLLPAAVWATGSAGGPTLVFASAVALFVIWAHRDNLRRLFRGEEGRIGATRSGHPSDPTTDPQPERSEPTS